MTIAPDIWISAYADPSSVAFCLPVPGRQRICGKVVECKELPNFQPGSIPTCAVKIRGRTGKTMVLDFTACYGKTHASQAEAVAECEAPALSYETIREIDRTSPTPGNRHA